MNESPSEERSRAGRAAPAVAAAEQAAVDPDARYAISRYALIRAVAGGLIAESLLTGHVLDLSAPSRSTLFFSFVRPTRPAELLAAVGAGKAEGVRRFLEHCAAHRLLGKIGGDGVPDDGAAPAWEVHDLYFHLRSRRGRHAHPVGATFWLAGTVPPVPAVKPPTSGSGLALARPGDERAAGLDRVLERRRSRYSVEPVDLETLGGFLYRTCRITNPEEVGGDAALTRKVYPSGGGLHSLEAYVVARRCPGLAPGLYHYRPLAHELSPPIADGRTTEDLLVDARRATGGNLAAPPSVLIVLTSRFARVTRKYQSLAYSVVLKEVGALFQTMYLVATAMELAPCALGAGDSEVFSRVSGTDPFAEPTVGEFILGGRP